MTQSTPSPRAPARWWPVLAWLLAAGPFFLEPIRAQAPTTPPGFHAVEVFADTATPAQVRGIARAGKGFAVARGRSLDLCQPDTPPRPLLRLRTGESFGFVTATPTGLVLVGELHSGRITELDPLTGTRQRSFAGPPLAFDATLLPSGNVLVNANPNWPTPGAQTGVWLTGPGLAPRELLPLTGPSGPLALDPNGNLVVAELGRIVPPPPGAARLLRFDAAVLQLAITTHGTLTVAQASAIGSGYDGLYDLAIDDQGRVHSSNPATNTITQTAPFALTPHSTTVGVGGGRYGLWLHFEAHAGTTWAGYQPSQHAPAVFVASSDFVQHFGIARVAPRRPQLSTNVAIAPAHSTTTLRLSGAPPGGAVLLLADAGIHRTEQPVAAPFGNPLWFGLPLASAVVLAHPVADASGHATMTLTNPGSHALPITCQCAVLNAAQTGVASSTFTHLQLLR